MKKFTSLLICACVLITNLFVFTSCIHFKCDFSEEWSNDDDSHWHECTNGKCEKISDKESHLFNEGEIKVKATQEADGIRIQTCSTCNAKKEVPVLFTGLDWTEWELALSEEKFANFTYHEKAVVEYSGVQVISVAEYKFTENEIYASLTVAGSTSTDSASGLQAASTKKSMIESIQKMLKYGEFEYDRENKIYNLRRKGRSR